ncbi:unnamed protein product [Urochloa decumbens]|uniref:Uncharacterized protein n=1 Tax=Urochloa decumbens TaxID=240449 RepID=A0ABC9BA73_9POAL
MPSSSSGNGLHLVLAATLLSLTAVATSTSTDTEKNPFTWLDCPSLAPVPSPSPPPSFMPNNTFRSNVLALLDALPPAAAPAGFASLSRGDGTDEELAIVRGICRGDSTPDGCAGCLRCAAIHIIRRCSSNRRAAIWYDKCFLSYADTNASTTYEEGFRQEIYSTGNVSNDKDAFSSSFSAYLNFVIDISDRAVNGGSSEWTLAVPMFVTGEAVYGRGHGEPNGTMYGMVQCMRDRTASECALCLWNSMVQQAAATGLMLGYNCYLRVEVYPFYNVELDVPPPPAPPSPLAPAPARFIPTVGERNRNGGSVRVIAGVAKKGSVLPISEDSIPHATTSCMDKIALSSCQADSTSAVPGITVDKSVHFSNEELYNATEGFSMSNKIGQGGFGSVYYAELRGKKAAIKKMALQATKEFLAELKVLTHVHHQNLVRLMGYCIETSLFVVYEYIENGNLRQHLCGTGYEPLSWAGFAIHRTCGGIAVPAHPYGNSAPGIAPAHKPLVSCRDIKSANILIDKNYRAKFEQALDTPDPKEGLQRLIDPALGEDYPMDSILGMTVLARACTQEDPESRPTMRSVVVALMTLTLSLRDEE